MTLNCHAQKNKELIGTWVLYKVDKRSTPFSFNDTIIFKESVYEEYMTSFEEKWTKYKLEGNTLAPYPTREITQRVYEQGTYERIEEELIFKNRVVSITPNILSSKTPSDKHKKYKFKKGKLIFITPVSIKEGDTFKESGKFTMHYFHKIKAKDD